MAKQGRSKGEPQLALLRGINVGGHKKVPMAELRALVDELGWSDVATYIQSGNVVFRASGRAQAHEAALEEALAARFGFEVSVLVRNAEAWHGWARGSAFPEAAAQRPRLLHLGLWKGGPKLPPGSASGADCVTRLAPYCRNGEEVAIQDGALWIDYRGGAGKSKLTPAVLDRAFGAAVTLRNWNTVQALDALARGRPER